jgi:hypothetical protein
MSKSAGPQGSSRTQGLGGVLAGLEACDTADLEICGTGREIITILVRIASFLAFCDSSWTFFFSLINLN